MDIENLFNHTSSLSESVPVHGKEADKKENGSTIHMSYLSSAPVVTGNNQSSGPPGLRLFPFEHAETHLVKFV